MRHLGSFVLCLITAAAVYVLMGVAAVKFYETQTTDSGGKHWAALGITLVAALAAGGLYSLMVLARLSPIGTVFAGLLYLGVGLWSFLAPENFLKTVPRDVPGVDNALTGGAGPLLFVLAFPLLLTVFSPRRWRRWGSAPAAVAPAPGYRPPPITPNSFQEPSYAPYGNEPASPAGSYAAPGSPVGYPPPSSSWGDDPEQTRRL